MKKLGLLITFIILQNFAISQITQSFNDTFNLVYEKSINHVFADEDYYYGISSDGHSIDFLKFNHNGILLQEEKTIDSFGIAPLHRLSKAYMYNNKFVIFTLTRDSLNRNASVIFIVDKSFNIEKKKIFDGSMVATNATNMYFTDIKSTPDEGFMVCGNYGTIFSSTSYLFLMKLDKYLNVQWAKAVGNSTTQYYGEIARMELTPDLGILLYTSMNGRELIKTNALGDIIWERDINNLRLLWGPASLLNVGNSEYVVARTWLYNYDIYGAYANLGVNIIKFNHITGQIIWDKQYVPFHDVCKIGTLKLHNLPNGNIALSTDIYDGFIGSFHAYEYCTKAGVIEYNLNGDSINTYIYDFGPFNHRECELLDMIILDDGSFLGCGEYVHLYISSTGNSCTENGWLFKTKPDHTIGLIENPYQNNLIYKISPNPTDGKFEINFDNLQKSLNVIISTSTGSVYLQGNYKNINKLDFTLKGASGIYFLKMFSENGESEEVIIKK